MYTFELAGLLDLAVKKDLSGIYNFASSTSMTKHDFLMSIADQLGLNKKLIEPIFVEDFGFKAKRGKDLSLNVGKLRTALSVEISTIEHSIGRFVEDFKIGVPKSIAAFRCVQNIYPISLGLIPYGRQSIDDDDIGAVVEVLKSDTITQGERVSQFESALC